MFFSDLVSVTNSFRKKGQADGVTGADVKKLLAKINSELNGKARVDMLVGALAALLEYCRRAPGDVAEREEIGRIVVPLLELGPREARTAFCLEAGCVPEAWMSDSLVRACRERAWNEAFSGRQWTTALRLALVIRTGDPPLFERLHVADHLPQLFLRACPLIADGRHPQLADGFRNPRARALVPASGCTDRPVCFWRLALLLEAADHGEPDEATFRKELSALIEHVTAPSALAWVLRAPWQASYPQLQSALQQTELRTVAQKILRTGSGRTEDHEQAALEHLTAVQPTDLIEFLDTPLQPASAPRLLAGARQAARELGVPCPDGQAETRPLGEREVGRFALALFLFRQVELSVAQVRDYVSVLARVAPSNDAVLAAVKAVVERLRAWEHDAPAWDAIAWAAAESLSAGGETLPVYRRFLDSARTLDRTPLIRQILDDTTENPLVDGRFLVLLDNWPRPENDPLLAVRVFWRLLTTPGSPVGETRARVVLTDAACRLPACDLVEARLALDRHRLIQAESHLRHCADDRPRLAGRRPLAWDALWQELTTALEHWSHAAVAGDDPAWRLWLALAQNQAERSLADDSMRSLTNALLAAPPESVRDSLQPFLEQLLGQATVQADTLVASAQRLADHVPAITGCVYVCRHLLEEHETERVSEVDDIIEGLRRHAGISPALRRDVNELWVRVPRFQRDQAESLRRLHAADRDESLDRGLLTRELLELPPAPAGSADDQLWGVQMLIRQGHGEAALQRYDLLAEPLHQPTLDCFWEHLPQLPAVVQRQVASRWIAYYTRTVQPESIRIMVLWLLEHPGPVMEDGGLATMYQGLQALAGAGDATTVGRGVAFLNDAGRAPWSRDLLRELAALGRHLEEPAIELYEQTCAGLETYDERRDLRYALASLLEAENAEKAHVVYARHFEGELWRPGAISQPECELLAERLRRLLQTRLGEPVGGLHVLLGAVLVALGDCATSLDCLRAGAARGAAPRALPWCLELCGRADPILGCEVAEFLVELRGALGPSPEPDFLDLLERIEQVYAAQPDALNRWQTRLRTLCASLESADAGLRDHTAWKVVRAWLEDMGRPLNAAWEQRKPRFDELLGALERHCELPHLQWVQERLAARAVELPRALLIHLLRLTCAAEKYSKTGRVLAEAMYQRYRADAADVDLETAHQGIGLFCDFAARMNVRIVDLRLNRVELDFDVGDVPAALSHAQQLLDTDTSYISRLFGCAQRFPELLFSATPSPALSEFQRLLVDRYEDLDPADRRRYFECALQSLQYLASYGPPGEIKTQSARRFHEAAARRGPVDESRWPEVGLARALMELAIGEVAQAEPLLLNVAPQWLELSQTPTARFLLQTHAIGVPDDTATGGAALLGLLDASVTRALAGLPAGHPNRKSLGGHVCCCRYRVAIHSRPPEILGAIESLRQLHEAGEEFNGDYRDGLDYLISLPAAGVEEDGTAPPDGQMARLILWKLEHALASDVDLEDAARQLARLQPRWSSDELFDEGLVRELRKALVPVGGVDCQNESLMRLRLTLEQAVARRTAQWEPAVALAASYLSLNPSAVVADQVLDLCQAELQAQGVHSGLSMPLVRRLLRDHSAAISGLAARLAEIANDGVPPVWAEDFSLLASYHPRHRVVRQWAQRFSLQPDERAQHCFALLQLQAEVGPREQCRRELERLAAESDYAAFLAGLAADPGTGADDEACRQTIQWWDGLLQRLGPTEELLWGVLPAYAGLQVTRRRYDEAHRLKLREAQLKIHDAAVWREVITIWKRAREAELQQLGQATTPATAITIARLLRLLLRAEEAVRLLQAFRPFAKGEELGVLLCELGICLGATNRYDLAIHCHKEADAHLTEPKSRTANLFSWGVALSYLQQTEAAREVFRDILARDISHEGARNELAKLDLPSGVLQLHQLTELSQVNWNVIFRMLRD